MDLPSQNVPTTDNQGTSKAIVTLLMSLHSKASQQPPSAELILSPSPQNLHLSPGSILLGTWLVLVAMSLARLLSAFKGKNSSKEHGIAEIEVLIE